MEARFRIRTCEGQELEPRTLEIFSEMVRSGVIRPQDLVFDALTAQWVEAGRHPMVRLFQDPLVENPTAADVGLGLSLAEPSGPSQQEREAAFIREMEEERRSDPERVPLALELPVIVGRPEARAPQEAGSSPEPWRSEPLPGLVVVAPPRRPARAASRRRAGVVLAGAAATLLALLFVVVSLRAPASPAATLSDPVPARWASVAGTEREVRDGARARFLEEVAELRDQAGLALVPEVWLEGRYLADAAAHPEVRAYWDGVGAWVEGVMGGEDQVYREAWLASAESLGVSGPVRSLRLATALEDFAAAAPTRQEHYRRVRELAASAVALHDILVELGVRVTYEPMRGGGLSADPVLEAAGADPAAQMLLEEALDRVLAALKGPEGDSLAARARLGSWLAQIPL